MDVDAWLGELGLGQYRRVFVENDIDWDVLAELTEDDLEKLGISLGHRKKILRSIRTFVSEDVPPEAHGRSEHFIPREYTPPHLADRIRAAAGFLQGERKQVTILFADIKGSLELIQGADAEQASAILDAAIQVMMHAVHRYEGTVNKVLGDGIMAIFGAPIALEDHAVRACYAALTMVDAIANKSTDMRQEIGVEIQVRVGLHSGEVVVRGIGNDLAMDYDAIGPTTHLASRMEQLALPGTVRLSADTARLAEGLVEARSLGLVPVKGVKQPIELFELTAQTGNRSRFSAALARGLSCFVGREAEMAALQAARERVQQGQGQVFATIGEPGLGKSRLYHEFLSTRAANDLLVLSAGSVSYGKAMAYLPVVDLLKSYFKVGARDTPRDIREKVTGKLLTLDDGLRSILTPILDLLDVLPEEPDWNHLEPVQRRHHTISAIKTLLTHESTVQPLVVIFEDLHWVDGETQAVLDSLVESLPMTRILLLVNYRPEYGHRWGCLTYYTQCRLEPLPPESAEALLDTLLGMDPALMPLKQLLIERAEGNPFFAEECVRTFVEVGHLTGVPGAYHPTGDVDDPPIPASILGVLAARIDRLQAADKQLLQSAAVIGKDVPFRLLQAIVELPEGRLNTGLSTLQGAEFLFEAQLLPERELSFKHALTHEVAYGGLLSDARRALHRKIAEAIEQLYVGRLSEHWERLAYHFTEAGQFDKAVTYWHRAGERAVERSAYQEAVDHLRRGLKLVERLPASPDRDKRELDFLVALGVALQGSRGPGSNEVGDIYTRARDLGHTLGDSPNYFAVLWGLWRFYRKGTDFEGACRLLDEMFDLADARQDAALLLEAHHAGWSTRFFIGDFDETIRHVESGLELFDEPRHAELTFRFGGHDPRVCGMVMRAHALWVLGFPDHARRQTEAALTLAKKLDHPATLALAIDNAAQVNNMCGEFSAVLNQAEALIALSQEHAYHDFLASGLLLRQWALLALGRSSDGAEQWTAYRSSRSGSERETDEPSFQAILVEALRRLGMAGDALEVVLETLTRSAQLGTSYWDADLLRLKGEIVLAHDGGAIKAAEDCFHQAVQNARQHRAKSLELRATLSMARLWQRQGAKVKARDLLLPVYDRFDEGFDTADLRGAKALLDELS